MSGRKGEPRAAHACNPLAEGLRAVIPLVALAAVVPWPAWALSAVAGCPAPTPATSMRTTFASEFTQASGLDPKQWAAATARSLGDPAIEAQVYRAAQVSVVPGAGLRLSTVAATRPDAAYESGAVTTRGLFSQAYGHFEMMARMPEANGLWPAFWLLPADGSWPPEIDIVEFIFAPNGVLPAESATAAERWRGSNPATTLHWGTADHHSQAAPGVNSGIPQQLTYQDWNRTPPPAGWSVRYAGYHTYAIDWRPRSLVWLIDGSPVFCLTDTPVTGQRVPAMPMYMLVNDAVSTGTRRSPGWPGTVDPLTPWPQSVDVAYVRVSQFTDLPAAPTGAAGDPSDTPAAARTSGPPRVVNGKVGPAEARLLPAIAPDSPDLCVSGRPDLFRAGPSGWSWQCLGSGGGSTDPTGLAFRKR